MKKIAYTILFAASALSLFGCSKERTPDKVLEEKIVGKWIAVRSANDCNGNNVIDDSEIMKSKTASITIYQYNKNNTGSSTTMSKDYLHQTRFRWYVITNGDLKPAIRIMDMNEYRHQNVYDDGMYIYNLNDKEMLIKTGGDEFYCYTLTLWQKQ